MDLLGNHVLHNNILISNPQSYSHTDVSYSVYGIDNVAFGGVASVAEPLTLGGTVLASAIGLYMKRKQKAP